MGAVAGAWPSARLARRFSRRAAILIGGVVTAAGVIGILVTETLTLQLLAAVLLGAGGIVVYSSGSALLADATAAPDRARRFGQQIALGTIAAFLAAYIAGQLAAPVAASLGSPESSLAVLRTLVGSGGLVAAASALPILLVRAVPVPREALAPPRRRALLARFGLVEAIFGFGAGSFLPFLNLFFADRFGLDFATLGIVLGVLAVGGSLGALLHGIHLAPRLGEVRAVVLVQLLSVPFALVAGFAGAALLATASLAIRAGLMYGSASTFRAYTQSAFRPAERAGVAALLAIAWNLTYALGSVVSGAVRAALGDVGWTVNIATLSVAYVIAAALTFAFFASREVHGRAVAVPAHGADSA